jgi:hypothetical protein
MSLNFETVGRKHHGNYIHNVQVGWYFLCIEWNFARWIVHVIWKRMI